MKVDVLLGLQWGDEGKGKIVDVLTPKYDIIARFQGGPNAGHSLECAHPDGSGRIVKHVLHNIPSGVFHTDKLNIIGNGVVLDPVIFADEIKKLEAINIDLRQNLHISKKAHVILPSHRVLDAASEAAKGKTKIGSTLKGIGPTYMDKTGRNGLRVGDLFADNFIERYNILKNKHLSMLKQYDFEFDLSEAEEQWFKGVAILKSFKAIESEQEVSKYIADGKQILAEGAQGTMLDIDFGSYPFVTSSNTVAAGACTGLGVAPNRIGKVFGIFKAYCTRVGSGPFPTELFDETGEELRAIGNEFGATTGRSRRCGWLDMVALKYAINLSGVTHLIMTKGDVMSTFKTIKVATAYKLPDGSQIDYLPFEFNEDIEPVYQEFEGWMKDLTTCRQESEFPKQLSDYITFIEKETGVPVYIVSVGPERDATIIRK